MTRRHFLHQVLLTTGGLMLGAPGFSAPSTAPALDLAHPRFLFVFLRGGLDAANLLIPVSSSFYYESRPGIAIAQPSNDVLSALPLTADWGLHPSLRETLYPIYQKRELAFVPFSGSEDSSRSHFKTQHTIELGQFNGGIINHRSGMLNRLAAQLQPGMSALGMSFTDQLPLAMQGEVQMANVGLRRTSNFSLNPEELNAITDMYRDTRMTQTVHDGLKTREQVARDLSNYRMTEGREVSSTQGVERNARLMARMMKQQYAIGFVDFGGWDTHVAQGGAKGHLANRLGDLGRGLSAFSEELGAAWPHTVVVVMSEFGRTLRQNGNQGTDHGHGGVMWIMGGAVQGGRIVGEEVRVGSTTLFQNRDLPVLNEYRTVLAGLFKRQWGLSDTQLGAIFPGHGGPKDWGLI